MNFAKYLDQQTHEDRQAFIIHYPALGGKTQFVRKACQVIPGLHYVDMLEYSLANPELSSLEKIDLGRFKEMLLELDQSLPESTSALAIDQGDFMFNTWDADEKQEFLHWLRATLRTPSVAKRTFIFVIQSDGVLSSARLTNAQNQSRILALSEFDAL
jgi:hypothetical protein